MFDDFEGSLVKDKDRDTLKWDKTVHGVISLEDIESLDYLHNKLDKAVLEAYGLSTSASSEEIFARLMKLNTERPKVSSINYFDEENDNEADE